MIGRREKERENTTCCVCEGDRHACIEKIAAAPIPLVYSGHSFYFICASLTVHSFSLSQVMIDKVRSSYYM